MDPVVGLFVKVPEPGRVKTRLGRDVGMEAATSFYAGCVAWLLKRLVDSSFRPVVFYTPEDEEGKLKQLYGDLPSVDFRPQRGENLGQKMYYALKELNNTYSTNPLLIGSDAPLLPLECLRNAVASLRTSDVVLGPARDGGYYLVGMTEPHRKLFFDMEWSHSGVLEETLSRTDELSLSTELLSEHNDIDTVEDLLAVINPNDSR